MTIDSDPRAMRTPWGDADRLREQMLRPGPGIAREEVERSQRERLFGATVACVATRGYGATTVADLLVLAGVSRSAFYEHFRDKEECFLATFEAVVQKSRTLAAGELGRAGSWRAKSRGALQELFARVVDQPAAAGLCFSGIYTAGVRGRRAADRSMTGFVAMTGATIGRTRGDELPPAMVLGMLGGAQSIVQLRLRHHEEGLLPEQAEDLWAWALAYEAPSVPLRLGGRRSQAIDAEAPPSVARGQADRLIHALAVAAGERGYPRVTIAEVAARASVSQTTFYSHFADKQAALLAAIDSAGSQMLAVALPASRRAPDWANGVRAAIGAQCAFGAAEPDLARLLAVEASAGGHAALEQRDLTTEGMRDLLAPGFELAPTTPPIVADAVLGAVTALIRAQIVTAGPQSLPELAPLASYMVLAPFIGAKEAATIANGDGRGR